MGLSVFSGADPPASVTGRLWTSGGGEMLTDEEFGVRDFIPPGQIFFFSLESCCPAWHLTPRLKYPPASASQEMGLEFSSFLSNGKFIPESVFT